METKSYPQPGGIHDCCNTLHWLASPVEFTLTVIVSRGRIHGNIGHYLAINFDVDLIDAITEIFVVFWGDVVIFPKAFFKIDFPALIRRSGTFCQIIRFGSTSTHSTVVNFRSTESFNPCPERATATTTAL